MNISKGDKLETIICRCSDDDCDGYIEVHTVYEYDTGQTYWTDHSEDEFDAGCPKCGKPLKEE